MSEAELTLHSGVWAETLLDVPTDALLPAHQHAMRNAKTARDITALAVLQSYRELQASSASAYVDADDYVDPQRSTEIAKL